MFKRIFLLLLVSCVLFSCSSSKKTTSGSGMASFAAAVPKPGDDGLSFATAIVIMEKTEGKGVNAEYDWIKDHYSDYKVKGQSLQMHDKKPFDIITITLSDGKEVALYFDISNYFGNF